MLFCVFGGKETCQYCDITMPNPVELLGNKYSRLLLFGFWLLSKTSLRDYERTILFDKLELFSTTESQIELYSSFYTKEKEKELAKSLKSFYVDHAKRRDNSVIRDGDDIRGRDQILRDIYIDTIMKMFAP